MLLVTDYCVQPNFYGLTHDGFGILIEDNLAVHQPRDLIIRTCSCCLGDGGAAAALL